MQKGGGGGKGVWRRRSGRKMPFVRTRTSTFLLNERTSGHTWAAENVMLLPPNTLLNAQPFFALLFLPTYLHHCFPNPEPVEQTPTKAPPRPSLFSLSTFFEVGLCWEEERET